MGIFGQNHLGSALRNSHRNHKHICKFVVQIALHHIVVVSTHISHLSRFDICLGVIVVSPLTNKSVEYGHRNHLFHLAFLATGESHLGVSVARRGSCEQIESAIARRDSYLLTFALHAVASIGITEIECYAAISERFGHEFGGIRVAAAVEVDGIAECIVARHHSIERQFEWLLVYLGNSILGVSKAHAESLDAIAPYLEIESIA